MKTQSMMLVTLLFFVLVGIRPSSGGRVRENDLFIRRENPSAFDPSLSSITFAGLASMALPAGKSPLPCDEAEIKNWSGANNDMNEKNKQTSMFEENGTGINVRKISTEAEEVVYNVLRKRRTPSGPAHTGNDILSARRLSQSKHSPGVGHMEIYNTAKSLQQQRGVTQKRVLISTPSPGAGH